MWNKLVVQLAAKSQSSAQAASRLQHLSSSLSSSSASPLKSVNGYIPNGTTNQFLSATNMIPHPEKAYKGGEDACFGSNQLLIVADGVGGWASYGVDPGLYSKALCVHIQKNFASTPSKYIAQPKSLIIDSHKQTNEIGSTTCCVLTIDESLPVIRTSYIGDSGYVIYRKTGSTIATVFVSEEQQKSFNFPYQIGSEGDSPTKSLAFQHDVKHNDLIVVGTDGVFDNIDQNQILGCIKPFWEKSDDINDVDFIASTIAKYAFKLSIDPTYNSPFAKKALKSRLNFRGGKSDDISVVVAQVKLMQTATAAPAE